MVERLKLMSLLYLCVQGLDAAGFEPYVQQLEKNFAKGIRLGVESEANQPQVCVHIPALAIYCTAALYFCGCRSNVKSQRFEHDIYKTQTIECRRSQFNKTFALLNLLEVITACSEVYECCCSRNQVFFGLQDVERARQVAVEQLCSVGSIRKAPVPIKLEILKFLATHAFFTVDKAAAGKVNTQIDPHADQHP